MVDVSGQEKEPKVEIIEGLEYNGCPVSAMSFGGMAIIGSNAVDTLRHHFPEEVGRAEQASGQSEPTDGTLYPAAGIGHTDHSVDFPLPPHSGQ